MSSSKAEPRSEPGVYGDLEAAAKTALEIADKALLDGTTDRIPDEVVQRLMTAATKLFANKTEMEERFFLPFVSREAATPTDVVVTVSEMLRAVNLNTFDLSMWFRRPRPDDDA